MEGIEEFLRLAGDGGRVVDISGTGYVVAFRTIDRAWQESVTHATPAGRGHRPAFWAGEEALTDPSDLKAAVAPASGPLAIRDLLGDAGVRSSDGRPAELSPEEAARIAHLLAREAEMGPQVGDTTE